MAQFKTLWRDGTTHLVMSPLEFMAPLMVSMTSMPSAVVVAALAVEGQLSGTESSDAEYRNGSAAPVRSQQQQSFIRTPVLARPHEP